MFRTSFTGRFTTGIYEDFTFFLVRNFFQYVESVIEIIVNYDNIIVLAYFIGEGVKVSNSLAR